MVCLILDLPDNSDKGTNKVRIIQAFYEYPDKDKNTKDQIVGFNLY